MKTNGKGCTWDCLWKIVEGGGIRGVNVRITIKRLFSVITAVSKILDRLIKL